LKFWCFWPAKIFEKYRAGDYPGSEEIRYTRLETAFLAADNYGPWHHEYCPKASSIDEARRKASDQ
jgi:hypothetical protein